MASINKYDFLSDYTNNLKKLLDSKSNDLEFLCKSIKAIPKRNKIIICGNGGSSSIASHVATDITKSLSIPALTFSDHNLITCYANDYGFENWIVKSLKNFVNVGDLVLLISSSGKSMNMIKAAKYLKRENIRFITLSGFKKGNQLSKLGDYNIWINSNNYNFVEMSHHILLVAAIDKISKINIK